MNILFFSLENLNNASGVDKLLLDLVAYYPSRKDRLAIFTSDCGGSRLSDVYINSVLSGKADYYKAKVLKLGNIPLPTFSFFRALYLRFKASDVVWYVYGFMFFDLLVLLLKVIFKKKTIIVFQAPLFIEGNFLHNIYIKTILRATLKYYDKIHTVNKEDSNLFKDWGYGNKTVYLPNGIKMDALFSIPVEDKFLESRLRFAFAGRFERQKSIDLLINVIPKLVNLKIEFYFAGKGTFQNEVINLAEKFEFIKYLGFLDFDEMEKIFSQADIFVFPSRQEPFGVVMIEALASGLPVIASKTSGPLDLLKEGETGWFLPEVSAKAIYDKLIEIYNRWFQDRQSFKHMPLLCREKAKEYTIENVINAMQQELFL